MRDSGFQEALLGWYRANAREMPWRVPPGVLETGKVSGAPIPSGSGIFESPGAPIPSGSGSAQPPNADISRRSEVREESIGELPDPTLKGSGHPNLLLHPFDSGSAQPPNAASPRLPEVREESIGELPAPTLKGSGHPEFKNRQEQRTYEVWVSEIMLQQTTVTTVTPYYTKWLTRFPSLQSLAAAPLDDILAHWQGLGYYRRARMLHEGAKWVVQNGLPQSAKEWEAVPGVGKYTAGAIASIAQKEPAPLVDGNVERVVARLTANPACAKSLTDAAWAWAESQLAPIHPAHAHPGDWNQALMELGATVCKPTNPQCGACPVQSWCDAFAQNRVPELPTPKPKADKKLLHHVMLILTHGDEIALRPVPEGRWWAGLYEFPREDTVAQLGDLTEARPTQFGKINHVVTNHKITVDLFHAETSTRHEKLIWVTEQEIAQYAIPAPAQKALTLWNKSKAQKTLWEPETSPD